MRKAGDKCGGNVSGDYTLCGLAHDTNDTYGEENITFVTDKQKVTFPDCLEFINYVFDNFGDSTRRG